MVRFKNWRGTCLVKEASKKLFFSDGIKKHVKRWNRSVQVEGDYVGK
jgi:hypothetical protein